MAPQGMNPTDPMNLPPQVPQHHPQPGYDPQTMIGTPVTDADTDNAKGKKGGNDDD